MNKDWTEMLRDKLADYTETPPENLWQDIESRLDKSARTSHKRLWLYAAAACVAVFIGVLSVVNMQKEHDIQTVVVKNTEQMQPQSVESSISNEEPLAQIDDAKLVERVTTVRPITKEKLQVAVQVPTENVAQPPIPPVETAHNTAENEPYKDDEPKDNSSNADGTNSSPIRQNATPSQPSNSSAIKKMRQNSGLALNLYAANISLGLGSNGNAGQFTPSSSPIFSDPTPSSPSGTYPSGFNSEYTTSIKEQKHRQPLRLGLSLAYPLSSRLSLNAGITFNRLSTEIIYEKRNSKGTVLSEYSEEVKQTNIGVPVGVTYKLLEYKPVSLYIAAGGMAEQCVSGAEKRPQLSVYGGAGLQVSLSNLVSIYAEPLATYYIDNHSNAINIYKDRPTNFDFRLGLRFSLNGK